MMKLYELQSGDYFKLDGVDGPIKLHHIDGMYSYCTRGDDGEVLHLAAFTEVNKLNEEVLK